MPVPIPFLRPRRAGPVSPREASEADLPAIEELLRDSPRTYSGMGGAMREALRDDIALAAWQGGELAGFAMAHRQGPQTAWLHGFGLAADVNTAGVGRPLLQALEERLGREGVAWIAYMDEYTLSWLRHLVEEVGFRRQTRVVAYDALLRPPPDEGNRVVEVRPAGPADVPTIASLDQAAFGPLWAYSERVFHSVLGKVACFLVAWQGSQPIGYVLGTLHGENHAHIVRLAVHPQGQGQRIGVRLLAAAFRHFLAIGARAISLNTQEENSRSQRLYRWFGFRPTGDEVGVWVREVTKDERPTTNA